MSYEDEFDELMPDTVTREPFVGRNDYGEPSFGSAVSVRCRVVRKPEVISVAGGESSRTVVEKVSSATVWCSGGMDGTWDVRDRITLPDGTQPSIIAVHSYPDEDGRHHQKVLV